MKVGDLVRKIWGHCGRLEQNAVGICVGRQWRDYKDYITVIYPGQQPMEYRSNDFEVISESK